MEIVILYGFICSGKSTKANEYKKQGYKVITFDDDSTNFAANMQKSIELKENAVIDAPVWSVTKLNDLSNYLSSFLCKYVVYPTSIVKVLVLPHLELDEVLSRVKNRWESNPEHVNHAQYKENLEFCLKDIEFRYIREYQIIKFDYKKF